MTRTISHSPAIPLVARAPAPVVIKLGGRALEAPGAGTELAASLVQLAAAGSRAVLVHGGGRELSDWCRRLGHEPRFDAGLRVTDPATLEVAAAVLGGLANARLVASLRAGGLDAAGLSAADGGLIAAAPHPEAARLGHVGIACGANPRLLELLLAAGVTPVVSSIGAHSGALLNLNGDEVAGALAAALRARALIVLSDVAGVMLEGRLVPRLHGDELATVLAREDVRDGMIPKLQSAGRALAGGAASVIIGAWRGPDSLAALLAGHAAATVILPSRPEVAHA